MKRITKDTILVMEGKEYKAVEVDSTIYWQGYGVKAGDYIISYPLKEIYQVNQSTCILYDLKIVAKSRHNLVEVPIVNMESYVKGLAKCEKFLDNQESFIEGYNSNPNQYTKADLEKMYELSKSQGTKGMEYKLTFQEIMEQINTISKIVVDSNFKILSYE